MAIDYGTKKCGLATTDPLRIIVTGLDTIPTHRLLDFLNTYLEQEVVDRIVIGEPRHKDGRPTHLHEQIVGLERKLRKRYPAIDLVRQDEFYTSKRARQIMLDSGLGRKKRREKERVDKLAAVLILEDYMNENVW